MRKVPAFFVQFRRLRGRLRDLPAAGALLTATRVGNAPVNSVLRRLFPASAVSGHPGVLAPLLVRLPGPAQHRHGSPGGQVLPALAAPWVLVRLVAANTRIVSAAREGPLAASAAPMSILRPIKS